MESGLTGQYFGIQNGERKARTDDFEYISWYLERNRTEGKGTGVVISDNI